jgi:hypothetical protein
VAWQTDLERKRKPCLAITRSILGISRQARTDQGTGEQYCTQNFATVFLDLVDGDRPSWPLVDIPCHSVTSLH